MAEPDDDVPAAAASTEEAAGLTEEATGHDPDGLELAHLIAESVRQGQQALPGLPPPRRRPKRPAARVSQRAVGAQGRDPVLLGSAIDELVDQRGWWTAVNLHVVLARWPALVGASNADHSTPESFTDKVLTIRADSTAWASSLRTMAPQLVAILNERLGQGTVARVVILGPDAPSWKHGRRSVRDGRGPRDTYG